MKRIIIILLFFPLISISAQNIDIDILRSINLNRNKNFDVAFRGISNSVTPVVIGTPVILYGIGLIKDDSQMKQNSIYIGASVLTSAIITTIVKYSTDRSRPFVTYPYIEKAASAGSPSFPSGHTSDAFALATSLSISYPKWYVILPSYLWAGAVGYSRMDLGVHYPSDVLMGAIIGAGSAYLSYQGKKWLCNKNRSKLLLN